MKNKIFIIIIMIVCFFSFNTKVKADDYGMEYLEITYEFINSNEYYMTYKFKPKAGLINTRLYLYDDKVYLDSIERTIESFEIPANYLENSADMVFSLKESKEYIIKYKGFLNNPNQTTYMLCKPPILKEIPRYSGDYSSAVSADYVKISIINPEYVKLTKDKIVNAKNLKFIEDDKSFVLEYKDENGNKNDYRICLELAKKEEEIHYMKIITVVITAALLIYLVFNERKRIIVNDDH